MPERSVVFDRERSSKCASLVIVEIDKDKVRDYFSVVQNRCAILGLCCILRDA
jgi:hypothetical protein